MSNMEPDADCLRESAMILRKRTRKHPFTIMVIIKVLEKIADRIESGTA